jgi:hypothetical protein
MPNTIHGSDGDQFKVHTSQQLSLGQEMRFPDGRRFRYARADANTAVVVAKLYQAALPVAEHVLETPAAAAVGARTVSLTLGAVAVTADQYRDGYLVVSLSANTGFGYIYQIDTHGEVAASGVFNVPLRSSVQVAIAATAASTSLVANNYGGVILAAATTPTAVIVGVSVKPIPVSQFGWIQVAGNVMCLTTGTVVIGTTCYPSTTTGAVLAQATATDLQTQNVGIVTRVATTTNYSTITLANLE